MGRGKRAAFHLSCVTGTEVPENSLFFLCRSLRKERESIWKTVKLCSWAKPGRQHSVLGRVMLFAAHTQE